MTLRLLHAELDDESLRAELRGLRLLRFEPVRIHFSSVHIDAHLRERTHAHRAGIRKVSGKTSHGPEILWIRRGNMKGAEPAIGNPSDMKLVVQNLEIAEKFDHKFRKDFGALFEEQSAIGRGWYDDDVTQAFCLFAPIPLDSAVDRIHRLGTPGKRQHRGICLCSIVAIRKNDLVVDCGSGDILDLIQHFRRERMAREHHGCCGKQQSGTERTAQLHRSAPHVVWLRQIIPLIPPSILEHLCTT